MEEDEASRHRGIDKKGRLMCAKPQLIVMYKGPILAKGPINISSFLCPRPRLAGEKYCAQCKAGITTLHAHGPEWVKFFFFGKLKQKNKSCFHQKKETLHMEVSMQNMWA